MTSQTTNNRIKTTIADALRLKGLIHRLIIDMLHPLFAGNESTNFGCILSVFGSGNHVEGSRSRKVDGYIGCYPPWASAHHDNAVRDEDPLLDAMGNEQHAFHVFAPYPQ